MLVTNLGTMPYGPALELQRSAARARIDGSLGEDLLLLVEHPPVVTTGRNSRASSLGVTAEFLASRGVELFEVERGGDVTFHGPGQLVGYPIFDLKGLRQDLHWYLRQLEEALIRALGKYGLAGVRNPGYTGVWTPGRVPAVVGIAEGHSEARGAIDGQAGTHPEGANPESLDFASAGSRPDGRGTATPGQGSPDDLRKIASIGVHARDWVTWHGFALNVNTDLSYFDLMTPCGIPGVIMTSVESETGARVSMDEARSRVARAVAETFGFATLTHVEAAAVAKG